MQEQQQSLERSIGLPLAIILTISSIIGSGVFKKVAPMMAELQSPGWVLAAWVLAGIVSLAGALSVAELSGQIADSGGAYVFLREIYGKTVAFFFGWGNFAVIRTASISSIAYVFAESVHALVPVPETGEALSSLSIGGVIFPFANLGVKLIAILLIAFLTLINYRGLRYGSIVSRYATSTVVISLVAIVLLGLFAGSGGMANISTNTAGYARFEGDTFSFVAVFFSAMLAAFWAYEGWITLSFIGGEIKNPNRNLPLAILFGMLGVIAIYLSVNFAYMYVLPAGDLIAVHESQNQVAAIAVVERIIGPIGRLLIAALIIVSTFGCTNTTILLAARLYYKMAQNKEFFKAAGEVQPRFHTPGNALLMQGVWAAVLILSGSFDQLTDMLIFASFIFYGLCAFGVFILRRRNGGAPSTYRVPLYPVLPALFVLFCIALVVITMYNRPGESLFGLVLILTGAPFYYWWTRKNGRAQAA
ncbi:MAG: APC family permease [Haliscomenobacter sp.]